MCTVYMGLYVGFICSFFCDVKQACGVPKPSSTKLLFLLEFVYVTSESGVYVLLDYTNILSDHIKSMDQDLSTSICIDDVITELDNIHHILSETGTLQSVELENCMFSHEKE